MIRSPLDAVGHQAMAYAGLDPATVDVRTLRRACRIRMKACQLTSPEEYAAHFHAESGECHALAEELLIGETSFFRDAAVFEELARWCSEWFSTNSRPLQILSAPCSTGEEPYSVAAMLLNLGIDPSAFEILAVDLSEHALEHARAGLYHGFSLRNIEDPKQCGFLERAGRHWRVSARVRQSVRFERANLTGQNALGDKTFDLILSRNLLLYSSEDARAHIASLLANALRPRGRLIVGTADWGAHLAAHFELERPFESFALRVRGQRICVAPESPEVAPAVIENTPRHAKSAPENEPQVEEITQIFDRALRAFSQNDEKKAEKLCRKVLYLQHDHLPSLDLLNKLQRPQLSQRVRKALQSRLHRLAHSAEGDAR
jgi:chemotaxis protein methyltransferase WspC